VKSIRSEVLYWTGHEDPAGEQRHSSTLSLTSALDEGGFYTPRPYRFSSGKKISTHCIDGGVGPRGCVDGCRKARPNRASILGTTST
jgi:hypothetical protein